MRSSKRKKITLILYLGLSLTNLHWMSVIDSRNKKIGSSNSIHFTSVVSPCNLPRFKNNLVYYIVSSFEALLWHLIRQPSFGNHYAVTGVKPTSFHFRSEIRKIVTSLHMFYMSYVSLPQVCPFTRLGQRTTCCWGPWPGKRCRCASWTGKLISLSLHEIMLWLLW